MNRPTPFSRANSSPGKDRRRGPRLLLAALLLFAGTAGAWGATYNWTGLGSTASWTDINNWGGSNYPGNSSNAGNDVALFPSTLSSATIVTIPSDITISYLNIYTSSSVTINLNSYTLTVSTQTNFGVSSNSSNHTGVKVTISGEGTLTTAALDTNENAINVIDIINYAKVSVTGTFYGDHEPGYSATFKSTDGTGTLSTAVSLTNVSNLTIESSLTLTNPSYALVSSLDTTTSTFTVKIQKSGTDTAATYRYFATVTNSGTTDTYALAWASTSSSITATSSSVTAFSSSISSFTLKYPSGLVSGDSISVKVYLPDGVTLIGTVTYTKGKNIWTGSSGTSWNTAGNWSDGVPVASGSNLEVVIPNTTNKPALASNTAALTSLTIEQGASLTMGTWTLSSASVSVATGATLSVGTGTLAVGSLTVNASSTFTATSGTVSFTGTSSWTCPQPKNCPFGNLTIASGTFTPANDIYLQGNWTNGGTFTANSKTVYFTGTATATIAGSNTFYNLSCTAAGKNLIFTDGTTQTIGGTLTLTGASGNPLILKGSGTLGWTIDMTSSSSVAYVDIRYGNVSTNSITAVTSHDGGNNDTGTAPCWVFTSATLTWDGSADTDWDTAANWDLGYVPNGTDSIIIPSTGVTNTLSLDGTARTAVAATVNGKVGASASTVITLTGTIAGALTVGSTANITSSSVTWSLTGSGATITSSSSDSIGSLAAYSSGTVSLASALLVNSLALTSGTLAAGNNALTVSGNITGSGSLSSSGTISFTGTADQEADLSCSTTGSPKINAITASKSGGSLSFSSGFGATSFAVGTSKGFALSFNTGTGAQATAFSSTSATTLSNTGTLSLGNNSEDKLTFYGGLTEAGPSQTNAAGEITAVTGTINFTGTVSLTADTSFIGDVTFKGTVNGTSASIAHSLGITGNAVFGDAAGDTVTGVTDLSVSLTSEIFTNTITTSGTQSYEGAVTLNASPTLSGSTVSFLDTVDGNAHNLTVTGNAVFGNGTDDAVSDMAALEVSGTSALYANITTTGTQTFTGNATLGNSITLSAQAVRFYGTVAGASHSLTIIGDAVFGNAAADSITGLTTLSVSGTSAVYTDTVTSSGNQSYGDSTGTDTISLYSPVNFTSTGGAVRFYAPVAGNASGTARDLTVNGNAVFGDETADTVSGVANLAVTGTSDIYTSAVTSSGTQTWTGAVKLWTNATLSGGAITFSSPVTGSGYSLTIANSGLFTTATAGDISILGPFSQTGAGANSLAGDISTAGTAIDFTTAISLTGDVVINTNETDAIGITGTITLSSTVDGAFDLALISGTGTTAVVGAMGLVTPLGTLTLQENAANSTGAVTLESDIAASDIVTFSHAYNISLLGGTGATTATTIANDVTFLNTGTLTLGNESDDVFTFSGGLTATAPSAISAAGTIGAGAATITLGDITEPAAATDTAVTIPAGLSLSLGSGNATVTGTGAISTASGGSNLTVNTTGSVVINGSLTLGTGKLTVTQSGGTSFGDAVTADTAELTDTTGTIAFEGNLTLDTLTTTAQDYAVSITGPDTVITDAVTFSNTGLVTLGDGTSDTLTFNGGLTAKAGDKSIAGTIAATANNPIDFGTNADFTTSLTTDVTVSAVNAATTFGNITDSTGAFALTIQPTSANGDVTVYGSVTLDDLVTATGNYSVTLLGESNTFTQAVVFQNTKGLILGNAVTDSFTFSGGLVSTSGSGGATNTFQGTVQTDGSTGIVLDDLTVGTGGLTVNTGTGLFNVTGTATVGTSTLDVASSNFTIGEITNSGTFRLTGAQATHTVTAFDTDSGITEYYGSEAGTIFSSGMGTEGNTYYDLSIASASGTKTAGGDLTVQGNWANSGGISAFAHGSHTVSFTKSSGTISVGGSNLWHIFSCAVPGVTIEFQNESDTNASSVAIVQRIDAGGTFQILGASANRITLTRPSSVTGTPTNPPASGTEDPLFWFFDLTTEASLDMAYVNVYYSNARLNPISVPATVNASPYTTYHCYKWLSFLYSMYSYTEDSDYDGKIDRIRVTCEADIGNDFSGFTAIFKGGSYEVDTSKGTGGYGRPETGKTFYIYLKEKTWLDTGATPLWRVSSNSTLKDAASSTKLVDTLSVGTLSTNYAALYAGDADHGDWMLPGDTAWPRVGYTLTQPGGTETFVQFSETLLMTAGDNIGPGTATFVPISGSGAREVLVGNSATGLSDLAAATLLTFNALADLGTEPWWEDAYDSQVVGAPDPTYPPVTGYTAEPESYTETTRTGFTLSGGAYPNNVHRATDVLLSKEPQVTTETTWFAWPLWAKDGVSLTSSGYESLSDAEASSSGIGLVRAFDGSRWLRDQDITLEARLNSALSGTLSMIFASGVGSSYLATAANGPTGLWLPSFTSENLDAGFSGIVPLPFTGTSTLTGSATGALRDFSLLSSDANVRSGETLGFFFKLDTPTDNPLYMGRLDCAWDAADWYRHVAPFSFRVQDVTLQRGSVTIMNNVIDPTAGETVKLSYQLSKAGPVTIQVFTLDGDVVQVLFRGSRSAGDWTASWDGRNKGGRAVARGMYFIRVVGPEIDEIRKVMIVKD